MSKIHLDTDIGGDMDDLCALAMLLYHGGTNAIKRLLVLLRMACLSPAVWQYTFQSH